MPAFRFDQFKAATPRVDAHLLPPGYAQTATNCKLVQGILQAFGAPSTVIATQSGIKTLLKYGSDWLAWTHDVSVVRGLAPGDNDSRIYWTGEGTPRTSDATLLAIGGGYDVDTANYYKLGVPAPTTAPTVTVQGNSPEDLDETRTYNYCWAYKGKLGGKLASNFTQALNAATQSVHITGMDTTPPSQVDGVDVDAKRFRKLLFRYNADTGIYRLIARLAYNEDEYYDNGTYRRKRVKSSAFQAGSIDAPGDTPSTSAVSLADDPTATRTYKYCWVYKVGDVWYRSTESNSGTVAALKTDTVLITAMDAAPASALPGNATHITKRVFRLDNNSRYKQVAKVPSAQTTAVDRKQMKTLGANLTRWSVGTVMSAGTAPTCTVDTPDDLSEVNKTSRYYRYTFVNSWGEESAPSPVSALVELYPWHDVDVGMSTSNPSGYNVTHKRLYRTDLTGNYVLVNDEDIALATATYSDVAEEDELGEAIQTTDWDTPSDDLEGIVGLPNGGLAGFVDNQVVFSVPKAAYAFPADYQYPVEFPIVALGVTGGGVVVATQGNPYFCPGTDPASMIPQRIDEVQACVSATSLVDMGEVVMYASPEGIVAVAGGEAKVVTRQVITPEQWAAYVPSSIRAVRYQDKYLAFYDTGSTQGALLFDPGDPGLVSFSLNVTACTVDPLTGYVYVQIGSNTQRFDAGSALTYVWKSGRIMLDQAINPACARVDASAYPVTFKLYADGTLKHTQTVATSRAFRLPAGYQAFAFEVQMEGTADIRRAVVATSMAELGA